MHLWLVVFIIMFFLVGEDKANLLLRLVQRWESHIGDVLKYLGVCFFKV